MKETWERKKGPNPVKKKRDQPCEEKKKLMKFERL